MNRFNLILTLLFLSNYQFAQNCILQAGGNVTVEISNFQLEDIIDNGSNCTLDYSFDYKVNNPDDCGVYLQGVVVSETGSQTTFIPNSDGGWHTAVGKVYDTNCSGSINLKVSGSWGYPCSFGQVNYPGVTCASYSFGALPVEMVTFSVIEKNGQMILEWETASEKDNDYFDVQHSLDGENFSSIGRSLGIGNSTNNQHYSFFHKNPSNGLNYYRLKQVDLNGDFEYSKMISKNYSREKDDWLIYPNPTSKFLTLKNSSTQKNTYKIFNSLGELIFEGNFLEEKNIELSNHPSGIYFLFLKNKRGNFFEKIVKED